MLERRINLAIVTASTPEIVSGSLGECLESLRRHVSLIIVVWREAHEVQFPLQGRLADGDVLVQVPPCGVSAARNYGLGAAQRLGLLERNTIVCFPDDDCRYPDDMTAVFDHAFNDTSLDFLIIPYGPDDRNVDTRRFPSASLAVRPNVVAQTTSSVGIFARGHLFLEIGFDPALGVGTPLGAGEDLDVVYRFLDAGFRGAYTGHPVVLHPYSNHRRERDIGGLASLRRASKMLPGLKLQYYRAILRYWRGVRTASFSLIVRELACLMRHSHYPPLPDWFEPRAARLALPRVQVAPGLNLTSTPPADIATHVALNPPTDGPTVLLAAHVTTFLARRSAAVAQSFSTASAAYVDGKSISILGQISGYKLEKLATTDLVPLLIHQVGATRDGEALRVAILGGEPGVADQASVALPSECHVVYLAHGYQENWYEVLKDLRNARPNLVIVGLGMPNEAKWIMRHLSDLPADATVVTVGGWLRLLAGIENRSPMIFQKLELEWLYRLLSDPQRTFGRYSRGFVELSLTVPGVLLRRALR